MRGFFGSIGRFPLLLGAIALFAFALWEESHNTYGHTTVAIVSLAIGAVLLGGWFYSLVVDAERRQPEQPSAPPATGETQDGAEES
jgi:hypothetical protein